MRSCPDLPRLQRSQRDLAMMLPSCHDLREIAVRYPPSPRLLRTCQDCTEIVEISPWCSWHSKSWRDHGKISSISPRFVEISPWCLWVFESRRDHWDLAMIFLGFLNLVKFVARFSTSRQDIFQIWLCRGRIFFSFSCSFPRATPAPVPDRLVAGRFLAKIVN